MKKSILILLFISIYSVCFSQTKVRFTHYSADDGLSQNRVMDIHQDKKGFMWFATWDGLNKFDGKHFKVYKGQPGDPNAFTNNRLNSLLEDGHGFLWIITNDYELYRLDPSSEKFRKLSYSEDKDTSVVKQLVNRVEILPGNDVCIIANTGCYLVKIKSDGSLGNLKYLSKENSLLTGNSIREVFKDEDGNTWFLTESGITVLDSIMSNKKHYFNRKQNLKSFSSYLKIGSEILLGDDNGQIFSWSGKSSGFQPVNFKSSAPVNGICQLKNNRYLITTHGDGVYISNATFTQKVHYNIDNTKNIASNIIHSFYKDKDENVWLEADAAGVVYFLTDRNQFLHFVPKSDELFNLANLQPNFFVVEDKSGRIWVHPRSGGFSEYNKAKMQLLPFYNDPDDAGRLFFNTMHDAYVDSQGNLWLSTRSPGLEKCTFHQSNFVYRLCTSLLQKTGGSEVRTIFQDNYKRTWIADKEGKYEIFDENWNSLGFLNTEGKITAVPSITDILAYDIMQDSKGRIWIASKGRGIIMLEENSTGGKSYKITDFSNLSDVSARPNSSNYYALLEDKKGRIWAGSYGSGLNLILEENNSFRFVHSGNDLKTYPIERCRNIRNMRIDKKGIIWIATVNGIIAFNSNTEDYSSIKFYEYRKEPLDASSLRTNDVHIIHIDENDNKWFGTFGGGLNKLESDFKLGQKPSFLAFTHKNGLASDIILGLEADKQGFLWLVSENSLTRFDTRNGYVDIYNKNYGLDPVTFSESSTCLLANGDICAGTMNGFYRFKPSTVKTAKFIPTLVFTGFYLFNEEVGIGNKNSPLSKNIDETTSIELKHNQDVFSIEFAALDYRAPENIQYSYRLDPVDQDWINAQKSNMVSYTSLSPGEYVFRVRSTNSEGFWMDNERQIEIIIKPSFWQTTWAVILYIFIGLSIFVIALYFFVTIYRLKSEVAVEQQVTNLKLRFFTNMSHELRTPLTLISGPVEHVLKDKDLSNESRSNLVIVQRNIDRMLRLINQLLDFRKIQNKKLQLMVEETPFGAFTSRIASNFEPTAVERGIVYSIVDESEGVNVYLDREKYDTIIYNLLSNAFKFTPGGKSVTVKTKVEGNEAIVIVQDEGKGIPKEKLGHVFERFFTDSEISKIPGTGIGLNLVKELVDLHRGTINVSSEVGMGTVFETRFKLSTEHFEDIDEVIIKNESSLLDVLPDSKPLLPDQEETINTEHQPLLLVVEDNLELRTFLTSVLSKKYRVADAPDGLAAWNTIGNLMPDFVVSDLMMPVMDGMELTKRIKSDERTCHIPVILLTAKSDFESKMEGMQAGVDDYITKPFSAAYLEARIENIFMQRGILQEKFRQDIIASKPSSIKIPDNVQSQDTIFLKKIMEYMEENMSNSELTVEMLVSVAGMGRTVFFNKLKGLLGISPIEFIKETRIKRAAQLLESGRFNVSEVSFQIGMNDARYFSKCFKQKYGVTPSEYKNRQK